MLIVHHTNQRVGCYYRKQLRIRNESFNINPWFALQLEIVSNLQL